MKYRGYDIGPAPIGWQFSHPDYPGTLTKGNRPMKEGRLLTVSKPVELLVGANLGILRMKLGQIHCMTPYRTAIREITSEISNWHLASRELRRGFYLEVISTLREHRDTFRFVITGK